MTSPRNYAHRLDLLLEILPKALQDRAAELQPFAYGRHRDAVVAELVRDAYAAACAGDLPAVAWCLQRAAERAEPLRATVAANRERNEQEAARGRARRAARYLARLQRYASRPEQAVKGGLRGRVPMAVPGPVVVATDGSARRGYLGWGYIASTGHWGCTADFLGGDSLAAEIRAAAMAAGDIPVPMQLLLDSSSALAFLRSWRKGVQSRLPAEKMPLLQAGQVNQQPSMEEIAASIASHPGLALGHVSGHTGHLLNEAADSLAKIARECREGSARRGNLIDVHARITSLVTEFLVSWRETP